MEKFGIWFGGTEWAEPVWFQDKAGNVYVFDTEVEAQTVIDNFFAHPGEEITVKSYDGDAPTFPGEMWLSTHSE